MQRAIDKLDEEKKEPFYGYLKTLLIGSGCSASEAEEVVRAMEEEEREGMIRLLSKERKAGRMEGRREGQLEAKREAIFEVLEERFGKVPEDIKEVVEKITDAKVLSSLLRKSISVKDFDEFRGLLKTSGK